MTTAVLYAVIAATAVALAAAGTAVALALRIGARDRQIADLTVDVAAAKVATAEEARERSVAIARAERYLDEFTAYRERAAAETAALKADMERMRDAPHILDPDSRRAAWGRLLAQAGRVQLAIAHTDEAGADGARPAGGTDVLRGVDGGESQAGAAGGGTDRPGTGRPPG